jgi:hypothetical protein
MKHYNVNLRHITRGLGFCFALILCGASLSASAQDAKRGRDPFVPYKPVVKSKKTGKDALPVTPPSVQSRIESYKAQKMAAMSAQRSAPKPTTALLLSEMQVIGIFRTPRGYAAMIEATPIKLSYVIYPGEQFYDGQLVAIEENRLVFRQETRYTDGRSEMRVETKPLRQANAVADSMAKSRSDESGTSAAASPPSSEKQ